MEPMEPTEEMLREAKNAADDWLVHDKLREAFAFMLASVAEQARQEAQRACGDTIDKLLQAQEKIVAQARREGYEEAARIADDVLRACITHEEREVVTTVRNLILSRALQPQERGDRG